MGNNDVVVKMSAQNADLLNGWKQSAGGAAEFTEQLKKSAAEAKKANAEALGLKNTVSGLSPPNGGAQQLGYHLGLSNVNARALSGQLVNVKTMFNQTVPAAGQLGQEINVAVLGAMALRGVVGALKADLENFKERGKASSDFKVDVAQAQREAYRALELGPGGMKPKAFDARIEAMQRNTHASLGALYQGAASALSSRGTMSESESLDTLEMVAKIDPSLKGTDVKDIIGGTNDLRRAYGGSSKQAIGYMLAGMRTSRVDDIHNYAQNIVPGLFGLEKMGLNATESSSLIAGIGQESADATGALTTTGSLNFAKKVLEATAGVKSLRGKSFGEKLTWLQSDDKQAVGIRHHLQGALNEEARLAGETGGPGMTGRVRTVMAQSEMLDRGSKTFKAAQNAARLTPDYANAGAYYDENINAQQGSKIQKAARDNEAARTNDEQNLLNLNDRTARAAKVREMMESNVKTLNNYGRQGLIPASTPYVGQNATDMAEYDLRSAYGSEDPAEIAQGIIDRRRKVARVQGAVFGHNKPVDDEAKRMSDTLKEMHDTLKDGIKVEDTGARSRSDSAPRAAPLNNLRDN